MKSQKIVKIVRMVPGIIVATTKVMLVDPVLGLRLGRIMKITGPCFNMCNKGCDECMTHRLTILQGGRPSAKQRHLLMVAAEPLRDALHE
jgi:hypothetical protein